MVTRVLVGATLYGVFRFEYRGQSPGLRKQPFSPVGVAADQYGYVRITRAFICYVVMGNSYFI